MGHILPLSESNGGAPVILDSRHLPGKLVHLNPEDSGGNDLLKDILVGNLNSRQISIWTKIMGPGVAPVLDRSEMLRIDVPPSAEGTQVRRFYTPFVLEPGYSYYVSVDLQENDIPPYLYGYVERNDIEPEVEPVEGGGYGGLLLPNPQPIGDGTLDLGWDTFPWSELSIPLPLNFDGDVANNRFRLNAPGIWQMSLASVMSFVSSNSGRTTFFRLFDETDDIPASGNIPLYVGRDAEGVQANIPGSLFDIEPVEEGHWFRIEVGGGDTFVSAQADIGELAMVRVADETGAQRAAAEGSKIKRRRPRRR